VKYPSPVVIAAVLAFALPIWAQSPAAQLTYSQARNQHPGWVQVPGELIRPDCVHEVPQGATVEIDSNRPSDENVLLHGVLIAHYDPCPEAPILTRPSDAVPGLRSEPGTGNGWVEASQWTASLGSGDNIDELTGDWAVPSNPTSNGALIYFFNGIEPSGGSWILQPVLQYGVSPAGGGNHWAIASWLVPTSGPAYHSPLVAVNPGDILRGSTQITAVSGGRPSWNVNLKDVTTGTQSPLNIQTNAGLQWNWALTGVLEAYGVTSCSAFPANYQDAFTNAIVDHGYPSYLLLNPVWGAGYWYSGNGFPPCSYGVAIDSRSTFTFCCGAPFYILDGNWVGTATFVESGQPTTYTAGASISQSSGSLTAIISTMGPDEAVVYTLNGEINGNTVKFTGMPNDPTDTDDGLDVTGTIGSNGRQVSGSDSGGAIGTLTWDGSHTLTAVTFTDDNGEILIGSTRIQGQHLTGQAISSSGDSVTWNFTRQ
jgi:hypothetical protein